MVIVTLRYLHFGKHCWSEQNQLYVTMLRSRYQIKWSLWGGSSFMTDSLLINIILVNHWFYHLCLTAQRFSLRTTHWWITSTFTSRYSSYRAKWIISVSVVGSLSSCCTCKSLVLSSLSDGLEVQFEDDPLVDHFNVYLSDHAIWIISVSIFRSLSLCCPCRDWH